jgi:hypothetical protein
MRRTIARLAAACALAVTFTTSAVAGNPDAPGQQKKDDAAAAQPAPQQQGAAETTPPGQAKKSEAAAVAAAAPAPAQAPSTSAGVKPSSTTTHWTHCRTGGSAAAATCTAEPGTPAVGADVSKRYGNGKTAAQIAVSHGAPAQTLVTGPGNSQPHKVSDCRHKNNHSGGVDVHAVKSHSTSCATETQQVQVAPQVSVTHVCGQDIVTSKTLGVVGVLHGKNEHLMTNTKSAHFTTKHTDKAVVGEVLSTQVVPTSESCGSSPSLSTSTSTSSNTSSNSNSSSSTSSSSSSNTSNASVGTQSASPPVGGVLGTQATVAKPKAKPSGGVLGTVSNVAGGSLPFTGFPIWVAGLLGLGLVASGVLFWRRGATTV